MLDIEANGSVYQGGELRCWKADVPPFPAYYDYGSMGGTLPGLRIGALPYHSGSSGEGRGGPAWNMA